MKCPNRVQVSTCMFSFDSSWWHSLLKTDLMISLTYSTLPVKLIPAKWGDFVMLSPNVCPEDGIKFTTPRWKKQQQKNKTEINIDKMLVSLWVKVLKIKLKWLECYWQCLVKNLLINNQLSLIYSLSYWRNPLCSTDYSKHTIHLPTRPTYSKYIIFRSH